MTISKKIEQKVKVNVVEEGKPIEKEVLIKTVLDIDNSEEKIKALESSLKLIKLEKEIREQIKTEELEKITKDYNSMLQDGKFN